MFLFFFDRTLVFPARSFEPTYDTIESHSRLLLFYISCTHNDQLSKLLYNKLYNNCIYIYKEAKRRKKLSGLLQQSSVHFLRMFILTERN